MHHLTTYGLSPQDSFDFWREVTRGTYDLSLPRNRKRELRLSATMWHVDDLTLSEFRCQPNVKWRDQSHIQNDGRAYVKIRRYLSGGATYVTKEGALRLRPGATYLLDQSRPFSELSENNVQLNVFVPQDRLEAGVACRDPILVFDDPTEAGAIARAAINRLYEVARTGSVEAASSAADDFCTVLNSLMQCGAEDCEDATIMRARHHTICSEIDRWLTDPSLTVERLVSVLPFSRAGLYRHFDGKAGIASYFRQRRLGIAFQKLSATEPSKGAVGRIAGDVGYASTHSFTKAFRTAFNFTPGEILGTKTTDPEGIPPAVSNAVSADEGGQAFRRAFHSIRSAE